MTELPSLGSALSLIWTIFPALAGWVIVVWAGRQNDRQSGIVAHLFRKPPLARPKAQHQLSKPFPSMKVDNQ